MGAGAVRALLDAGADADVADKKGKTVLMKAIEKDHVEMADLLRRHKPRMRLRQWREATRAWCVVSFWMQEVGRHQYAPGMPGQKRCRAAFEAERRACKLAE